MATRSQLDLFDTGYGLPSDAVAPPLAAELSPNTRTIVDDDRALAPTVMAYGIGDVKMWQAYLDAPRSQGARRLAIAVDEPCQTVMAGGVGDVNRGQYTLVDGGTPDDSIVAAKPPYRIPRI